MVTQKDLQNRIVALIGGIAFPETLFEETVHRLENNKLCAQALLFKYAWLDIHNPEYILTLQDPGHRLHHAYTLLCKALLGDYVAEAVNCQILYNYLHRLEIFCHEDSDNLEPAQALIFAEKALREYLAAHGFEEKFRLRHRHLLSVWFLFPQFIHNKQAILQLLENCPELNI